MSTRGVARVARANRRRTKVTVNDETDRFVYLTVVAQVGTTASVNYHGTVVAIPKERCFGCGTALPDIGEKVAVHVNGNELVITGRHLP